MTLDADTIRWHGVVLLAAGGALRIWPVFVLSHRFSGLVAIQPGHKLVTSDVYGIIRHPSYLGLLVNWLGWALAFRSGVGLLLTVLLIPPLVVRIRAEERMLRTEFGGEYDVYCSRTWRLSWILLTKWAAIALPNGKLGLRTFPLKTRTVDPQLVAAVLRGWRAKYATISLLLAGDPPASTDLSAPDERRRLARKHDSAPQSVTVPQLAASCSAPRSERAKNRTGRVGGAAGRKDPGPGHVQIWDLVRLAVAIDYRIAGIRPHDGTAHQMDCRHTAASRPHILSACRLADL